MQNIIVIGGAPKLIDYDGMYLPELSGLPANEVGHVNYQHPARDASHYGEGMDRFGSFFTGPLFTEAATGRELNAIESENSKNLQSDVFRLYQIEKSRANSKHPYSKFYTGNKATLLDGTKKNKINPPKKIGWRCSKHQLYSFEKFIFSNIGFKIKLKLAKRIYY